MGDNELGETTGAATSFPHRSSGSVSIGGRTLSNIVSVAAGNAFGLALGRDGRVVAWGKIQLPEGLTNVVAIAARSLYALALKSDGTVVSWAKMPGTKRMCPLD